MPKMYLTILKVFETVPNLCLSWTESGTSIIVLGSNFSNRVKFRLNGVMFGGLRAIPTETAVDPPPYYCYNCRQHGHDMPRCPRRSVRAFCNNCGRDGVDLHDCPRCSAAHQRFVRANYANEQEMVEEI